MKEKNYPFALEESVYRFESVSIVKKIRKAVLLARSLNDNLFNLALMDVTDDGQLCDDVESRNGDVREVLATVFQIVDHFLVRNPEIIVGFYGNDDRRQRLYRIAITQALSKISGKFEVYGNKNGEVSLFEPNKEYDVYYIKRL
ncbi:DUF6934 family protein [Dyadobacter fermentans]|uniref:DUF6934 family protein n=1 Tax=Dyadobacter fermentans TaxID=94254 RepID=UPI001CBD6BB6|nr:hypothetical protein [Dyadobacter fermentans]MBZ1358069.1 hypothetical protein [Dyadobacter fermentans]